MKMKVMLFAGFAEKVGQREIHLDAVAEMTVGDLRKQVASHYPDLSDELQRALIAINRRYASEDTVVQATDEIGLIPPVGGGADDIDLPSTVSIASCGLTMEPLQVEKVLARLSNSKYGGTVMFSGTVREWTRNRQTSHLEYEAYEEMAVAQIQGIQREIEDQFPGCETVCWHRLGVLQPTEIAVICAAAAPHRNDAFVAARQLIDRVKKEVPIWKKEFFRNGDSVWQENQELF